MTREAILAALHADRSDSVRWVHTVYAVCLIGAGLNHAHDLWQGGWLPYGNAPLLMNVYWTSLTAFDPLAACLLIWRPRVGVGLTLAIIVSDVAVNSYAWYGLQYTGWYGELALQLQTFFLGFVVGSMPLALSRGRSISRTMPSP